MNTTTVCPILRPRFPLLALALTVALGASACETEGEPDPGGLIEAEQETVLSDTADSKIKLSSGDTQAKVTFKAGSGKAGTTVKGRLVANVMKKGATPASGRVIQITPANLTLSTTGTLVMGLDARPPGVTYRAIRALESDDSWTLGPVAALVDPTELNFGGGAKEAWLIGVTGPGLWGIAGFDDGLGGDGGTGDGPAGDGPAGDGGASTVAHTLVFHQITDWKPPMGNPTSAPVISADGSRIAFAIAPGAGDPKNPNKIYVINSDGTGLKEVDSYTSGCFCGSTVAISGDGKTVFSSEGVTFRVVGADGTLKGALMTGSGEGAGRLGITSDGSRVFFIQRRDNGTAAMPSMPMQRGVWTMNADASGLKQIAGPTAVAALTGAAKPDDVFPFAVCGDSLGVSADGAHVALATFVGGKGDTVLGVNGDGSGLHIVAGPIMPAAGSSISILRIALSGDGKTVVYRPYKDPSKSSDSEVAVIGFDGTGKKVLFDAPPKFVGGGCDSVLQPSFDGSQVLVSETGVVVPTAGGDPISLSVQTGYYSSDLNSIAGIGCCGVYPYFWMTGDGKRFVFQNVENAGLTAQIGVVDLDPPSLGAAPTITLGAITPPVINRDRSLIATVTAKVSGAGITRVGTEVLLRGEPDKAGSWVAGQLVMLDDGKAPDMTAGDGVFTAGGLSSGTGGEVGPRLLRIKADAKAADGRRHATAIDVSGLSIK